MFRWIRIPPEIALPFLLCLLAIAVNSGPDTLFWAGVWARIAP